MPGFMGGNSGTYVREGHGKKQSSEAAKKVEQHQAKEAEKSHPTLTVEEDFDTDSASLKDMRERSLLRQTALKIRAAFLSKAEAKLAPWEAKTEAEKEHGVFAEKVETKLGEKEMKRDVKDKRSKKANKAWSKVKDRRGGSEMSFFAGGEE